MYRDQLISHFFLMNILELVDDIFVLIYFITEAAGIARLFEASRGYLLED